MDSHRALVASGDGPARFEQLTDADLPPGEVTVDVRYSSLNYKDGLAVTGKGKIVRKFPLVCGIDLAGVVAESDAPQWRPGDEVIVTGWGLSETHPGGYTARQRVPADWLVHKPEPIGLRQSMAVGTAGLTAMLCVLALEESGVSPEDGGEVLVTGAAGGVGSVAVALLSRLGHRVTAATGRPETRDYLTSLGASGFVGREELAGDSGRPLDRARWSAAVDTVGGQVLATVLKQTDYRGAVAACGMAAGTDLPTSVLPFILRGIDLRGIDSVQCPNPVRAEAWSRLSTDLPLDVLDAATEVRPLSEVPELAAEILAGRTRGRVVVDTAA
ncbi:oxidoreductase [Saccharopolyspora sp. HNM0983]|uniref:Oxidoreductase n=1 Tax=Saccharopolyspora montiporae TaxID=2781240 RepID=A0A929G278_9PSEU|nr:MDR family oxidoreductase [Saccharopolyspora sp. HNM0983]MBE9376582.1 oxidoreductase [Saccharopolyspora sp. HNM0983]